MTGLRSGVALICLMLAAAVSGVAQTAKSPLTWGADAEGGAPYEFQDPRDPSRVIGFEVDIAEAIGRILGRQMQFVQNQWDGLVPGLERGNYDMIISGLEITPDRAQVISFSRPYYVTYEQLGIRAGESRIRDLEDCAGKQVGTLKGSLAQRILEKRGDLNVVSYDGQINAYEDLLNGRLDAVMMDYIIALYNIAPMPSLRMVGGPIGRLEYGIGVRKDDPALLGDINRALSRMIETGELRRILQNWNIWTPMCAEYFQDPTLSTEKPGAFEEYLKSRQQTVSGWGSVKRYAGYLPLLARGALVTLELSLLSMVLAVSLGLIVALSRLYAPSVLRIAILCLH